MPLRRPVLAVTLLGVVAAGVAVARLDGPAADTAGSVLYALAVLVTLALARPRSRPTALGLVALGVCVAVELAQLTPAPAALVDAWPVARFLVGTTFHAPDLVGYAAGAALGAAALHVLRRRGAVSRPGPAGTLVP